jgi:hypothetical protein
MTTEGDSRRAEGREFGVPTYARTGSPIKVLAADPEERMKIRKFVARIAPLIGLIAVGGMLTTPASADTGAPVAAPASFVQFSEILNPVFGGCLNVTNASTTPGARPRVRWWRRLSQRPGCSRQD